MIAIHWLEFWDMPPTLAEQHAFLDAAKAFDFGKVKALVTADPSYTNV